MDDNESGTTWNITGSQGFIAGSQSNFTQNNNHSTGFRVEDVTTLVEMIRRNGDLLELPDAQREELIQDAEVLEDEATSSHPDEGRMRKIARRIREILTSAPTDSMVQQMLLSAFNQGIGSALGG
ncbi:hypothetical protein GCM10010260_60290 [Streptomyces filipinensis]|uniref:Uncharacterized protein n=1 Tax=Streptomyces filipinensis TaxID=66887 RepID=A0A918IIB0_9ACTN|nr:hypothetical protein [Streptomyces filipinensis]GGV13240.1 hypothetical protein GCM10010260_60290 [Streptomyces filipinensis]